MSKLHKAFTLLSFCFMLIACTKQLPQTPSNKGNVADKNTVSLLAINQNLAKKEDSLIKTFALGQVKTYKKSPIGFWYNIDRVGHGSAIKDSVICKFSYRLLSLKGKMLQQDQQKIVVGKKQIVTGIEEGLKLMNKGDSATFIVPWYLAYGMKGNAPAIPAYTSIVCKINVEN
ncbi:MAG: FKBP-type peptidyl-prolyl cis-trans isomerase [Paludibacter sp.]|nr:FKBP-type peptidyl-prolyl cis-trans isomerase [Paludibacter sp.]